jgi:hypothetical protein
MRWTVLLFTALAWCYFYTVSIGPVVAINENVLHVQQDVSEFMYAPVIWLHDTTPLENPIERYAALWGWY